MESTTQSDDHNSDGDAPGAVYILPGEDDQVYVLKGSQADEDRELTAKIVTDLRSVIKEASSPSRKIRCALSSHRGDRAHISIVGEFPGLNHGFGKNTRFSEIFFAHDSAEPPDGAIEIDLP
ncbi:hypothetical protein [Haloarcula sp. H-GB5]|jgi:hypothetical protein